MTFSSETQILKAKSPISSTDAGIVIAVSDGQFWKTDVGMAVTLAGMEIAFKEEQLSKAASPISLIDVPNSMVERAVQPQNACA